MAVVSSRIDAVAVYRRGATVVRHAVIDGTALAEESVEITGLPLALLDPTVRVRVLEATPSTSTVTAASVRVGLSVKAREHPADAPEQKELQRLRRAISEKRELERLIDAEIELLESIPVPDRPSAEHGRAPPPAPLLTRLALEGFADDAATRRRNERRALATEVHALEEDLWRLESRIAAASTAHQIQSDELTKSAQVALRFAGERPSRVVLELSYVVPGARWAPAYQVKLARDGAKAEIQLRAHIAQRSGEDWRGVKLRLSTALPLRFTELPEMSSLRIGKAQPPAPKKGFRAPPSGGDVLFRDFDRGRERARTALPAPRAWQRPDFDNAFDGDLDDAVPTPRPITAMGAAIADKAPRARRAEPLAERSYERSELKKSKSRDRDDFDGLDESADVMMSDEAMPAMAMSAPPPPPAPAPSARMMAGGRGGPPAPKPAPRGGVDDVVNAMLFPQLRLPGAFESGRGKLQEIDLAASYRESLARFGRPFDDALVGFVRSAEQGAQDCGPQPPMTVDVGDVSSHFDFVYEADGVVDVDGDGAFHSVALGVRECPASVRYVAVPREELAVYRTAVITNPLSAPLLPGPAEVYVGGDYVLTTALPTVSARGELKLGLGVEQAVKIARNTRFQETRSGEGVVAMLELVHDIDIDVINHLGRAIDIEVRERLPVPAANAEVQVDERAVSPAWEAYTQEERDNVILGGRRWQEQVAAGGSLKLSARYVLKLFSNSEVAGGNRRER